MALYAITDIHGCARSFENLLEKIGLTTDDTLYLLGDYVDRGPDSKKAIDKIIRLKESGFNISCLLGNHEKMMREVLEGSLPEERWLDQGGKTTLESFGVRKLEEIDPGYWSFLGEMEYYALHQHFIFVHAGLNFKYVSPFADKESMVWIRDWYDDIDPGWLEKRIIIHGHTPTPKEQILRDLEKLPESHVLNLDAGCVWKDRDGMGNLCALNLDNFEITFQPYSE